MVAELKAIALGSIYQYVRVPVLLSARVQQWTPDPALLKINVALTHILKNGVHTAQKVQETL